VLREQGRSQTWLARRIGRSHAYVNRVLNGLHPAIPAFRAACAEKLGVPERDLFHDGGASSAPTSAQADGDIDRAGSAVSAVYGASDASSRRSA
jgi:transcriptional regulator with XRE-family HTH domain